MDFGITLPTPADSWKTVKRAEDAGFSTAWFYDTQVLSADIFVAMGAAAVKTDRIRLGTGVLIPSNRIVPVAANGLASLNALAPGRILAGFGTGFTGRRSIGLRSYKVSDMGDYIRAVTSMLRGETPEILIEGKARKVGFLNPETGLINIKDPDPGLDLGARPEDPPPHGGARRGLDQPQFQRRIFSRYGQGHGCAISGRRQGSRSQTQDDLLPRRGAAGGRGL